MIFELDKRDFEKILPLYLREKLVFPLILAVIQQKQRGRVFVDELNNPASAMIMTNFGFMQFVGTSDFGSNLIKFFKSPKPYIPSYLLLYSPSVQIQKIFDEFTSGNARRRERVHFAFNKKTIENRVECPVGFDVRYLDKELIKQTQHFNVDIGSRFWASVDDFLENGIGACVMKDGEIVSLCYSACVVDNLAETDVVTQEEYRGMGLAVIAAQCFISECLQRGITPMWDCFVNNTASMGLARKLGFEEEQTYLFYSFNLPVTLLTKSEQDYQ